MTPSHDTFERRHDLGAAGKDGIIRLGHRNRHTGPSGNASHDLQHVTGKHYSVNWPSSPGRDRVAGRVNLALTRWSEAA